MVTPFIPPQTIMGNAGSSNAPPGPLTLTQINSILSPAQQPAIAAAAGYNVPTFGAGMFLNTNWFLHGFYSPPSGGAAQNGNGIYLDGTGNGYGICTAKAGAGHTWTGTTFGGGAYIEALLSFPPSASPGAHWPAFWSQDIETLSQNAITAANAWGGPTYNGATAYTIGQMVSLSGLSYRCIANTTGNAPPNATFWQGPYGNWVEPDFFELDAGNITKYGIQMHNWYGTIPGASNVNCVTSGSPVTIPASVSFANFNKIGWLWIPATATTQGSAQWFFNGAQMGPTVNWNQYNSGLAPPPAVGGSAGSILDQRHLALVLNTNTTCPTQIVSVQVWQASAAGNLVQ